MNVAVYLKSVENPQKTIVDAICRAYYELYHSDINFSCCCYVGKDAARLMGYEPVGKYRTLGDYTTKLGKLLWIDGNEPGNEVRVPFMKHSIIITVHPHIRILNER